MKVLVNPYADVDWSWGRYKANLHTHTTESDGSVYGAQAIKMYKEKDYDILIITDHDMAAYRHDFKPNENNGTPFINTWGWDIFEGSETHQASVGSFTRNEEGIVANGMLTVEGVEFSNIHHINSYDSSYTGEEGNTEENALSKMAELRGLAIVNHPGEYNRKYTYYKKLYENNRNILNGMEVINRDRYFEGGVRPNLRGDASDRVLWDKLTKDFSQIYSFMSRPKIWGYSNDDMHIASEVGGNYQFMLMPKLNVKNFRYALENGHSYFSYEPARSGQAKAPRITNITVDRENKKVTVNSTGSFTWVVDGEESNNKTNTFTYNDDIRFFRAEIENEFGTSYTQPFILVPKLKFNWV